MLILFLPIRIKHSFVLMHILLSSPPESSLERTYKSQVLNWVQVHKNEFINNHCCYNSLQQAITLSLNRGSWRWVVVEQLELDICASPQDRSLLIGVGHKEEVIERLFTLRRWEKKNVDMPGELWLLCNLGHGWI